MSEPRPFASLSPSLLARKGSARPAMRPQLRPLSFDDERPGAGGPSPFGFGSRPQFNPQDDLGWNDMGFDMGYDAEGAPALADTPPQSAPVQAHSEEPAVAPPIIVAAPVPEPVVAASVVVPIAPKAAVGEPVVSPVLRQIDALATKISKTVRRKSGAAISDGRKAAFTLRVDQHRHLRLRLACALQNRSAQQLLTEALDRLLGEMPELDDLAAKMTRN